MLAICSDKCATCHPYACTLTVIWMRKKQSWIHKANCVSLCQPDTLFNYEGSTRGDLNGVSQVGSRDIAVKPWKTDLFIHPMNEKIGTDTCLAIETAFKANLCSDVV